MHTEQHMRELYRNSFVWNKQDKHVSRARIHYSRNGFATLCGIEMNLVYGPHAGVVNKWVYTTEWVVGHPDDWACRTCWRILEKLEPEWMKDFRKRAGLDES